MKKLRGFFGTADQEGQAVVIFALVMLTLLFFVGLAIDAGQLYAAKRTEQEASDSAAFAGAVILYQGGTGAQAVAAALDDAGTNGFVSDDPTTVSRNCPSLTTGSTCVTVSYPPVTGAYIGRTDHVEVVIVHKVQTALVPAEAAFNPVRARGVAGAENLNSGYAIMALDRGNTANAFNTSPNGDVHLNGGGILVNSTSASAANNSENNPSRFTITGSGGVGVDVNGGLTGAWSTDGIPFTTGHNQVPDPFTGFPTPDASVRGLNLPQCNSLVACQDGAGRQNPGVYNVNFGGAGNTNMTLNPGVYILRAGMNTAGNNDVIGTGVFIFNTYAKYPCRPGVPGCGTMTASELHDCGDIDLSGNANTNLSAQTTGTWQNLLLYQDLNCTNLVAIEGNGTFTGTGSFYTPSAAFTFNGNNATLVGSQLIAKTVDVENGNVTINYNPATTAQPILPRLAE
jgi:Flp pilus assembly protein TadG